MTSLKQKQWHIAAWPPLAWLETAIKLVALGFGIAAFANALGTGSFDLPGGVRLMQGIILGILTLGLIAAIGDRWVEREIVGMVFVLVNNAGHWGMLLALVWGDNGYGLALFAALMLVGDLVKLLFIAIHTDFTVRDLPRSVLYGLTGMYAGGYALLLLLEVVR